MRTTSRLIFAAVGFTAFHIATAGAQAVFTLRADNPLQSARPSETIAVPWATVRAQLANVQPSTVRVTDALGTEVVSQVVDNDGDGQMDELIFQADFSPGEGKRFSIE